MRGKFQHPDLKLYSSSCLACFQNYGCQAQHHSCARVQRGALHLAVLPDLASGIKVLQVGATTQREMQTLAGLQAAEETSDILDVCGRTFLSESFLDGRGARGRCGRDTPSSERCWQQSSGEQTLRPRHAQCRSGRTTALCFPVSLTDNSVLPWCSLYVYFSQD